MSRAGGFCAGQPWRPAPQCATLRRMFLAFLLRAAQAGSLQLPPGEEVDAWRAAAVQNGVELVAEAGDLVLVHEADRWELRFARDPATRFPLPPPASPEHRAAVLALAAGGEVDDVRLTAKVLRSALSELPRSGQIVHWDQKDYRIKAVMNRSPHAIITLELGPANP